MNNSLSSLNLPSNTLQKLQAIAKQTGEPVETVLETLINDHYDDVQNRKNSGVVSPDDSFVLYSALVDNMSDGAIIYAETGELIFANASACQMIGLSFDQMTGHTQAPTGWHCITPDGAVVAEHDLLAVMTLQSGITQKNVVIGIVHHPDASPVWVSIDTQHITHEETGKTMIIVLFTDISKSYHAEKALKQEQARMQSVLESIPGTIFTFNRDHTILEMYSAIATEEGQNYERFIGKTLREFVPPEQAQLSEEAIDRVFSTGKMEKRISTSYTGRFYDTRVTPIQQNDVITSVSMISIEVTDLIETERELKRSQAQMQAILHSVPGAIISVDSDLIIHFIHSAPARQSGLDQTQYVGQNLLEVVPESSIDVTRETIVKVFETGEIASFEAIAQSGLWYIVHVAPIMQGDEISLVTLMSLDITERKQAEDALKRSEATNRAILNSLPGSILTADQSGNLLSSYIVNPQGEKVDEIPESATTVFDLVNKENREHIARISEHLTRAFKDKTITHSEIIGRDNRWYDVRSTPTLEDNTVIAATFIALDIHERKLLEQHKFDVALEKERVQVMSQFIADASHEFRTPLAAMNTSLYLLQRVQDEEKRQHRIDQLQRHINSITQLVNDLLTISRLDGGVRFTIHEFNLNSLLLQLIAHLKPRLDSSQITVETHLDPDTEWMIGSGEELKIAFKKLLENAIRYTEESGQVNISTQRNDDMVEIIIKDNGRGMSKEEQKRALEHFYRSDTSHTTRGFGLGLPIAYKIIETHCGHVILESEVGVGTEVVIRLPVEGCFGSADDATPQFG